MLGILAIAGFLFTQSLAAAFWVPSQRDTFQWDLQAPISTRAAASVYDIDLFDNGAPVVAQLHALHRRAICYINVGSWENFRPDANAYPKTILGKVYPGYPDERYVNIRRIDLLGPILTKRFDLCKKKGFDAIEPDNIDTYQADTGFAITANDELVFDKWLIGQAHRRGLSIGQKNDPDQAALLYKSFDWALLEGCFAQTFCARFLPYVRTAKAVFDVEYRENTAQQTFLKDYCPGNRTYHYALVYKNLSLDSFRMTCDGHVDP